MKKILKKNFKKIFLLIFLIYVVIVLINQQKTLASYNSQKNYYNDEINKEKEYNESLISVKNNLDSAEYIEEISREKLDMFSANERVYININK